ncbi:hypothetical protein BGZ83_005694 [Gryganskiella cystojenkinii]|nr:hypothetical protein BGZ83_005694 [Gryganskiella cystojenkinii]
MADTKTSKDLDLVYRVLPQEHIARAAEIEVAGYPESEAATLETLTYRQKVAPELFLGCYLRVPSKDGQREDDQELVGYVVSTLAAGEHLTHDAMYSHDLNGTGVCIHSVCVNPVYHRRGIARRMMNHYTEHLKELKSSHQEEFEGRRYGQLERALLIAHEGLIGLYAGAGYKLIGPSEVVYGPEPWYEMVQTL